eukprot:253558_1
MKLLQMMTQVMTQLYIIVIIIMLPTRRVTRVTNKVYNYSVVKETINYSELFPPNSVVKLTNPNQFERKFIFCLVIDAERERTDDIIELLEYPAFTLSHINHQKLLHEAKIKLYQKTKKRAIHQIEPAFDSIVHLERYLLRQNFTQNNKQIEQLQNRIEANAGAIVRKHYQDINGSLNSINYERRCGVQMPKRCTIGLSGFLIYIRCPLMEIISKQNININLSWTITGRKPNRTFYIDLKDCRESILNELYNDSLTRSKIVGQRQIETKYKAYNISIKYVEKTIRMTTSYKIACKIGKRGRWKYTG